MLIDKQNIKQFIPQREPFVMIDTLISADPKEFMSSFKIMGNNIFLDDGILSAAALVENIAQTCAAGFGYINSLSGSGEAQLGFIGAVSKLNVLHLPVDGDTLKTEIDVLNTFDNINLIQGAVRTNDKKLLECQMKIVLA